VSILHRSIAGFHFLQKGATLLQRIMKRNLLTAGISLGIILSASRPLAAQTSTPSLAGSWQFTLVPSSPTAAAPMPIYALATFTSDGSVVETDSTEVVPPPSAINNGATYGTPAHGIWQPGPAAGNLFIQFINLQLNRNGSLHAKRTVTITGVLDSTGNQFSGNYSYQVVDSMGRTTATGTGTVTGQRIPHPLLP